MTDEFVNHKNNKLNPNTSYFENMYGDFTVTLDGNTYTHKYNEDKDAIPIEEDKGNRAIGEEELKAIFKITEMSGSPIYKIADHAKEWKNQVKDLEAEQEGYGSKTYPSPTSNAQLETIKYSVSSKF